MFWYRVLPRLVAIALLTATSWALLVLSSPLRRFASSFQLRFRNRVFRTWARALVRVMGLHATVEGRPPRGAFFLVANHLSYLDIIVIATQVDVAFVAKSDLRGWPFLGPVIAAADTVFIDRGRRKDVLRVMERIDAHLRRGLGILLFPEGTSSGGDGMLPFRPSLLQLAAEQGRPVHWLCLGYRTPPGEGSAQTRICWWRDMPFVPHVLALLRLPWFEARLRFGEEPVGEADRKRLAAKLRAAMEERFEPVL